MPNDTSKQVTSVTDWKKPSHIGANNESMDEGFIIDLPTGNRVKLRRSLNMGLMLASGRIPNPLAGVVQRMIDQRSTAWPKEADEDVQIQQQMVEMLKETAVAVVIDPPFAGPEARSKVRSETGGFIKETAEEYQARLEAWVCPEGHISIFDVDFEDQAYIFAVAQGEAADLARFREQSLGIVADVPKGQGVRKPTKRTGGTQPRKK